MDRAQVGLSSWAFPWAVGVAGYERPAAPLTAPGLLEKARELGAGVLQIADNLPPHCCEAAELDALAEAARKYGISLEVGTKGLAPGNLLRYLDIAARLGAKLVRTLPHDGADRPGLDEAVRRLREALPEYEQRGVLLGIENHDFYPSGWLAELMERVGSPALGVCLDPVNNLGQGESGREVFASLARHTVNFHCKDYTIARKPTMLGFDVQGAPTGGGRLDLHAAQSALRPGISWVIESWTPWQGDIARTVALEAEWARAGVECLKNL